MIVNKRIELLEKDFETAFKKSIQMFPDVPENILVVPISLFKKNLKFKNFMHRFGELDESNQSLHSFYFKTTLGTISSENNFLNLVALCKRKMRSVRFGLKSAKIRRFYCIER